MTEITSTQLNVKRLHLFQLEATEMMLNLYISDEGGMVEEAPMSYRAGEQPTLHEILVAEKLDFEAKVQRAARRKKWLKGNIIF